MREIKFRAWNIGTKIMVGLEKITPLALNDSMISQLALQGMGGVFIPFSDEFKIMQFTGLKDKNGKEIYEGDVLKDDTGCLLEVKFGKLPLDKGSDCVCTFPAFYAKAYGKLGQAPWNECEHIGEWMEIIGNIYESPELLKDK